MVSNSFRPQRETEVENFMWNVLLCGSTASFLSKWSYQIMTDSFSMLSAIHRTFVVEDTTSPLCPLLIWTLASFIEQGYYESTSALQKLNILICYLGWILYWIYFLLYCRRAKNLMIERDKELKVTSKTYATQRRRSKKKYRHKKRDVFHLQKEDNNVKEDNSVKVFNKKRTI